MTFKSMTLRFKLTGGFSIVLLLLSAVSLIGFLSLNSASLGFKSYREMARDANLAGRLQANMLLMRLKVKNFLIASNPMDEQQYVHFYTRMEGFLGEAQKEINDPERAQKIDEIDASRLEYNEGFKKAAALQKRSNEILASILEIKGPEAEKSLTAIMVSAERARDTRAAFQAGMALRHLLLARLYTQKYLFSQKQTHVERVQREFKEMGERLTILNRELQNPRRRQLLKIVITARQTYLDAFTEVTTTLSDRNTIVNQTLDRIGPEIATLVEDVKLDIKGVQDTIGPRLQASNDRTLIMILAASIVALVAGISLVFIITRSVLKQLGGDPSEIAIIVRRIADGNLSAVENYTSKGKLTGVYHDMEIMTENLTTMLRDISSGVDTLSSSAGELSSISGQLSEGAEKTDSKAENVSSSSEQMSSNMNSVAAAVEQAAANVSTVAKAAEDISSTIVEIAKSAEHAQEITGVAATKSQEASQKVDELGEAADQIGQVIEDITDISEKVNLLALNATIEAARAGEAGKGFAVVASEIKDLAEQTASATEKIKKRIKGVQDSTDATVQEIQDIMSVIEESNDIVSGIATSVDQQSVTTREIAENTSQASIGISEITQRASQSSAAASGITRDIAEINTLSGEITDSSGQVKTRAADLSQLSVMLKEMVGRFTFAS